MIKIDNCSIGNGRTFIIAEIGSNHNQDINLAKELVEAAKDCGADAVKFQSIKANELYRMSDISDDERKLLRSIELNEEWYQDIFSYAEKKKIICMSAPTYIGAVDLLLQMKAKAFKIASPQAYGFPQLIDKVAETHLPTFMSTGYCDYAEIERAVKRFGTKNNLILLHCSSNYPTKCADVNLRFIQTLKHMFGTYVGYSDHTLGINTAIAATAVGIDAIEKHITYSRKAIGPDHHFALEIEEFRNMVDGIREVEEACGYSFKEKLTSFERNYRDDILMRCYLKKDLIEGEVLKPEDVVYLRGDKRAISAWNAANYFGKAIHVNKERRNPIFPEDFL